MKKISTMLVCLIAFAIGSNVALAENTTFNGPQGTPYMSRYSKNPPRHLELDKKLNLTKDQKTKMEKNRQESREKLKPIMQKMGENRSKMQELKSSNLYDGQMKGKFEDLRNERYELRKQANVIREADMRHFESLLTNAQKKRFETIKYERRKQMKNYRKDMRSGPRPFYGR